MNDSLLKTAIQSLLKYCENQGLQGHDPYDALNSSLFKATPLSHSKITRLALTQFCKRSPINFRNILLVKKDFNPKGLGLFLSALSRLYSLFLTERYRELSYSIIDVLKSCSSKGYSGYCWGYNFDWQSRAVFVPKGTANAICTTFIANALLDAHEVFKDEELLIIARSACNFITRDLNVASEKDGICFSYTPLDKQKVHNVNLLCAALLVRVYSLTCEKQLLDTATKAIELTLSYQNHDGSWYYGTLPFQDWIDNFHTGFNLVALNNYIKFSGQDEFHDSLEKGFKYYKNQFFMQQVIPKYYHNALHPIDIHSVAQSIITFVELRDLAPDSVLRAQNIAKWSIENMQDPQGFFYFQKHKFFTNKISYIRWSQAWMFYALSLLLTATVECKGETEITNIGEEKEAIC